MKVFIKFLLIVLIIFLIIISGSYIKFLQVKKSEGMKKYFNIVLIGAAGSGKGTQGDLLKSQMNLLQVSAGEVLRNYRKNPNAKYTKKINKYIDKGQLVPSKITHAIIEEHIKKYVFCDDCKYDGIIFDGYPREMAQLKFLNRFLKKNKNKVDAVVYIDVPMEELVDRLSGRFSCSDCGELYHKKTKPTKVNGVCDKCGGTHFSVRNDDKDQDAIRERFKIFEDSTKIVLEEYERKGLVIRVDGTKGPKEVNDEINLKLKEMKDK